MLAKKFRLPIQKGSFANFKSLRGDYFLVKKRENNLSFSRFGVAVSRKAVEGAVGRNKIRRTVFNFINQRKLHLNPGFDFLISVLPPTRRSDKGGVVEELKKLLNNNQ